MQRSTASVSADSVPIAWPPLSSTPRTVTAPVRGGSPSGGRREPPSFGSDRVRVPFASSPRLIPAPAGEVRSFSPVCGRSPRSRWALAFRRPAFVSRPARHSGRAGGCSVLLAHAANGASRWMAPRRGGRGGLLRCRPPVEAHGTRRGGPATALSTRAPITTDRFIPATSRRRRNRERGGLQPLPPRISSILAAAWRCNFGTTCVYVLSVRLICEWPRVSMIVRGSTPCASRRVAAV